VIVQGDGEEVCQHSLNSQSVVQDLLTHSFTPPTRGARVHLHHLRERIPAPPRRRAPPGSAGVALPLPLATCLFPRSCTLPRPLAGPHASLHPIALPTSVSRCIAVIHRGAL
jgi:hypothetical protein